MTGELTRTRTRGIGRHTKKNERTERMMDRGGVAGPYTMARNGFPSSWYVN